jgi:hypothetical protein
MSEYREKAAAMAAMAERETDPERRAELRALERSYLRLALQADKNATADIAYETPPAQTPENRAVQQQQQSQPKKNKPE